MAAINLVGSFLLGALTHAGLPHDLRQGVGVGFLGGFTTLSTLTVQTVLEAEGGRTGIAAVYFMVSVLGGWCARSWGTSLPGTPPERRLGSSRRRRRDKRP